MKVRAPIYAKVLMWFLVNLLLLAALGYGFMRMQFRVGLDWMLAGPTGERIEQIADKLSAELAHTPQDEWPAVLRRLDAEKHLTFALFSSDGRQIIGEKVSVPAEALSKLIDRRTPGDRPLLGRPDSRAGSPPPKPRFIMRTENPIRYWAGIHIDLLYRDAKANLPLTLVMISDSLTAGGVFLDPWPWIALAVSGLAISLLVWLPFVSGMTRSMQRLNVAARSIAHGRFEERVPAGRSDELGELSLSVNAMAQQLGDYVAQQRRITADIAHELCSPIARMQMALGVVEQRSTPEQAGYLKKLDGELQHMAKLVGEVLAFSKADMLPERETATDIDLREVVSEVVAREAPDTPIKMIIEDTKLHTLRSALDRALGNVLRNAVRYASEIEIHGTVEDNQLVLRVIDQGPGVPEESLPRLFEAFYRPEAARGRATGGSGLGLAIAKRCIEACGGRIAASNRTPHGLALEIRLPH